MKKVMLLTLCLAAMTVNKAQAQEKTRPMDSMPRDNMRTPTDNMPMKMDTSPPNMRMRMDSTPPKMDMKMDNTSPNMPMKTMPMPNENARPDRAYDRKIEQTVNRMNRDTTPNGGNMRQDNELKGMYNGQRIRSDTIRNGVSDYRSDYKSDDRSNGKMKAKNKKALDGSQNGKYNSEMSRDSMPNGKYGDEMRRKPMGKMRSDSMPNGKYGDEMRGKPMSDDKRMKKMSRDSMRKAKNDGKMGMEKMTRDSMPNSQYSDKDIKRMAAENRSVRMEGGKVMIVRNSKMTVVKSFTNLNRGVKVMADGTIVRQDGTKTMLKEGESVNMMGEIMPIKQQ